MSRDGPTRGPRRRAVAVAAVALLVALAGCGFLGGGSSSETPADDGSDGDGLPPLSGTTATSGGGDGGQDGPTAAPDGGSTDAPTGGTDGPGTDSGDATPTDRSGESPSPTATPGTPSLSDVLASPDERAEQSFTVTVDTLIDDTGPGAVRENRTVRRGADGTAFAETRRSVTGPNASTLLIESYTAPANGTYVRTTTPGSNASTYQHVPAGSGANATGVAALDDQFDFDYAPTGDGGHRYTVDSADQIVGETAWDGRVRNISVVVVVSESGLVTELRYDVTVTEDDGTFEYHTDRSVSGLGTTTVTAPEWLDEAKTRTPP